MAPRRKQTPDEKLLASVAPPGGVAPWTFSQFVAVKDPLTHLIGVAAAHGIALDQVRSGLSDLDPATLLDLMAEAGQDIAAVAASDGHPVDLDHDPFAEIIVRFCRVVAANWQVIENFTKRPRGAAKGRATG